MAYEYEGYVKNTIRTEAVFSHEIEQKYDRILELEEVYRKAKAFDTFIKYKQHVEKYNNSDCHELERVFQGVIKEYLEDK